MIRQDRRLTSVAIAVGVGLILLGVFFFLQRDPARDLWQESMACLAAGRQEEAVTLLKLLLVDYPSSPYAVRARVMLGLPPAASAGGALPPADSPLPPSKPMTPCEKLFRQAQNFYPFGSRSRDDLREAAKRYLMVADSYPADPLAADALYEAANCLDQIDDAPGAVNAWKRLIRTWPHDGRIPEAYYALGFICSRELEQPLEGRRWFNELMKRYPQSSAAEAARANFPEEIQGESTPVATDPSVLTAPGPR